MIVQPDLCQTRSETTLLVFHRGGSILSHESANYSVIIDNNEGMNEPPRGKNQQCGFRTGPTQTGLYSHRKELEDRNFGVK